MVYCFRILWQRRPRKLSKKARLFYYNSGRLPEIFCKNFVSSIIEALSQLHAKGIAHRDLKLSNILINDEYDFKIADFGMAKI